MSQQALPKDTILFGNCGSYYIEEVIGRGGFGITYKASAVGDGLPDMVAIKEFFPKEMCSRTPSPGSFDVIIDSVEKFDTINKLRDRFIKESRNIERCKHPSIVRVLDTIECNGTAYMVMELVDGRTLKQLMAEHHDNRINAEQARDIISDVANALDYLHSQLITHLDVKPDNIMLTHDNRRVVLIDFGLSRQFNDDGSSDSTVLAAVSKGYAAPEQYLGITNFSPQSDVYSLGATFYKLLTGKTPPEPRELRENPALLTFDTSIPRRYANAIAAAMCYDDKSRISSSRDFVRMLEGGAVTAPIPTTPRISATYNDNYDDEDEEDTDNDGNHNVAKIILTVLQLCIVAVCGWLIYDNWQYGWQTFEGIIYMINSEIIISLATIAGVGIVGSLSRGYGFKLALLILTLLGLGFIVLNMTL